MKRCGMLLTVIGAILLAAAAAPAAGAGGKGGAGGKADAGAGKDRSRGLPTSLPVVQVPPEQWENLMKPEIKATPELWEKIRARIQAAGEALGKYDKDHAAQLTAAEFEMEKAKSASNLEQISKINQKLQALQTSRQELIDREEQGVLAPLTPEQKAAWGGYKLNESVMQAFARSIVFSPEQQAQIRALCNAAAAEIDKARTNSEKSAVRAKLLNYVLGLLTDSQKQAAGGGSTDRPHGGKSGSKGGSGSKSGKDGGKSGKGGGGKGA